MRIGITYIEPEVTARDLTHKYALHSLSELAIDTVRIGAYWNRIQTKPNEWNFDTLDQIVEFLAQRKLDIVLTVGMKAPRWPEFYIPKWLQSNDPELIVEQSIEFIAKVVNRYRDVNAVLAWQVENEPLDIGGHLETAIPISVLKSEIDFVRSLDSNRPIQLNFWGNNIVRRMDYLSVRDLADVIGIDIYYRQPTKWFGQYHGPYFFDWQLKKWIANQSKQIWVTELQADAWEKDHRHKWQPQPPSMNPNHLKRSYNRVVRMNPAAVLLWGYEYWLWHKHQGRPELWNMAVELFSKR